VDVEERKPAKKNQNKLPRKSLENCSSKLLCESSAALGNTVLCVWKLVALSVTVRARIPRHALWHLGAALAEESRSWLSQKTNPLIISIMV
jgi:hypothetical protein